MKKIRYSIVLAAFILTLLGVMPGLAQQPAPQPTPVEIKIDSATFDAYTGQYEDAVNLGGTIFSFFREGDKYYLQVVNQDRTRDLSLGRECVLCQGLSGECGVCPR